ncbi:helix-turn-helix domain-containing protein [Marinifilum caeruleilacunae]|uniref:AraC family transcriptional regulator n=1 Tax=Marinifilum caeruleilacunae TaxID=2499076 RepID=A0ABX1WW35_9BACT|nr:helix-turn-helix domain-containing protein [Marinifilum caeruleilacunae]NOU60343.1 AraC family transcriptional regulator [Marinifilum caeruleilacunae]
MHDPLQLGLDLFSLTDILSASMAFMLGVLFLLSKSENKKANVYLGLMLCCLCGEVLDVLSQAIINQNIVLLQTSLFTIPFLLLYIHQSMNSSIKIWYVLLFAAGIIQNLIFYLGIDFHELIFFEYLFNISILVLILLVIRKHREMVNNYYSDLEHKSLHWIKAIVYVFFAFHVLWIVEDIIAFQNDLIIDYFAAFSNILTFFMIFWIGHNGFSQSETFTKKLFIREENDSDQEEVREHSEKLQLAISDYENLCHQIQEQKLYTNPKLNLRLLSESVNLNEKEISRLINQHSKQNFYQFINRFRVEEFKRLLQTPKSSQLSLLGLAEEAGFNSKSTFYTTFKAQEGITPKQYELMLKKSE